jgi:adenosine deaminase
MPEVKADFEELIFWYLRELNHYFKSFLDTFSQYLNVRVRIDDISQLFNYANTALHHRNNNHSNLPGKVLESTLVFGTLNAIKLI